MLLRLFLLNVGYDLQYRHCEVLALDCPSIPMAAKTNGRMRSYFAYHIQVIEQCPHIGCPDLNVIYFIVAVLKCVFAQPLINILAIALHLIPKIIVSIFQDRLRSTDIPCSSLRSTTLSSMPTIAHISFK
jgi:hypothetical protein